jgi:3-oxoacyl-[acyl-carrier protein] reductase
MRDYNSTNGRFIQKEKKRKEKMANSGVNPLSGQVAVVTGAGRGIGSAISRRLASMGSLVVLCGRTRTSLEATAGLINEDGGECTIVKCDVTNRSLVENLAAQVDRELGRLDILVNNAAVRGFDGPLHQMPPDAWDDVLNTNLRGVFYCIRALAPLMIAAKKGHIVNISSLAGKNALPNGTAYAASKWGLNGLTYSVAEELRAHNIRVSAICPGSVNTDLSPHTGKDASKMLQPDDVAHVVEMLVTQASQSFVSEILIRPTLKP